MNKVIVHIPQNDKRWAFASVMESLSENCEGVQFLSEDKAKYDAHLCMAPPMVLRRNPKRTAVRLSGHRWRNGSDEKTSKTRDNLAQCHTLIATNTELLDVGREINPSTVMIPNGIDLDKWKPAPFMVGFCGNIGKAEYRAHKGFDLVSDAVDSLKAEGWRVELLTALFGDDQIDRGDMQRNFYWRLDCLVHPSESEGSSNTIMEALACSIPVITTKTAGLHGEELVDGDSAIFCERSVESVKAAIVRLIASRDLRDRLAANGRQYAEFRHDIKDVAKQYCSVFNTIRLDNIVKKKILAVITSQHKGWAHINTVKRLAAELQSEYEITIAEEETNPAGYDLIWCRGGAPEWVKGHRFIWTCGTGGAFLDSFYKGHNRFDARGIIVQNAEAARFIMSQTVTVRTSVWMCPNGVDTEMFKPPVEPRGGVFTAGFAGRKNNSGHKGWELAEEACKITGVPLKSCSYADNERLKHGDMPEFYRSIDVLLQPSDAEGCSNSLMEAMSSGLPCLICKESGYHGERCRDGFENEDGDAVIIRRDVAQIAGRLMQLKQSAEIRRRIGLNARAFAEKHAWPIIAEKMAQVFEEAMADDAPRPEPVPLPPVSISGMDPKVPVRATVVSSTVIYRGVTKRGGSIIMVYPEDIAALGDKIKILGEG